MELLEELFGHENVHLGVGGFGFHLLLLDQGLQEFGKGDAVAAEEVDHPIEQSD